MPVKQIIAIRRDLKMRRGKEIAQGAHASMAFLVKMIDKVDSTLKRPLSNAELAWLMGLSTKIVVQVADWNELIAVHQLAKNNGIESNLIVDAGLTEFNNVPTGTAVAIGPDDSDKLDQLFGHLKLY